MSAVLLVGTGVVDGVVDGCDGVDWDGDCSVDVGWDSAGVVVGAGSFGVASCSVLLVVFSWVDDSSEVFGCESEL